MRMKVLQPAMRQRVAMGRVAMGGLAVAGLLLMAGCSAVDKVSEGAGSILSGDFTGKTEAEKRKVDPSIFAVQKFCPTISVRGDGHVISAYARGQEGDPSGLRYQATIRKWARECIHSGDNVTIKVGIVGRVVGGPAGVDGPIKLPVRIAVMGKDDVVLASELAPVEVNLSEADRTEPWSTVNDTITVPAADATKIYIGFDEGKASGRR
jgi:hypothetical protein